MLRFFRPQVEELLLLTVYLQEYRGDSLSGVLGTIKGHSTADPNRQRTFTNAMKNIRGSSIADLEALLYKKLQEDAAPYHSQSERDLIDQIVSTLQLPYARNALSGASITALRQAILLPSEIGGLLSRLRGREMSCGNCGAALRAGEMATLNSSENHLVSFLCTRCIAPSFSGCYACREGVAELSSKAQAGLAHMQCATCLAKSKATGAPIKKATPPAEETPTEAAPRTTFGARATRRMSNLEPPQATSAGQRRSVEETLRRLNAQTAGLPMPPTPAAMPDPGVPVLAWDPLPTSENEEFFDEA